MGVFIFRKLGAALIVVFLASVLVFIGVRAIPGDPALAYAAEDRDPATLAAIRDKYGLDEPLHVQYVTWIGLALRGDLGTDSRGLPVADTIVHRLPLTLELAALALLIGGVVGITAGVIAAVRRGKPSDYAATTVALLGLSVPHFWLGLLMIIVFSVNLGWLPAGGYVPFREDPVGNLQHMLMPALVLGLGLSAVLMRQMRSAMLDSLGADVGRLEADVMQPLAATGQELGDAAGLVDGLEQLDLAAPDRQERRAHALIANRRLLGDPETEEVLPEREPLLETPHDEADVMDAAEHVQNPYARARSGSLAARSFARFTITLHCFQVASSCILPSSMRTPRPSGIASRTRSANFTSSTGGLKTRLAIAIWLGWSDQAPTQPRRKAARNWSSQPIGSEMSPKGP